MHSCTHLIELLHEIAPQDHKITNFQPIVQKYQKKMEEYILENNPDEKSIISIVRTTFGREFIVNIREKR